MWEQFEMVLPGETDQAQMLEHWHFTLWPACELFGVALVWSIGLEALGYPPTWIHTKHEARIVEDALISFARERTEDHGT